MSKLNDYIKILKCYYYSYVEPLERDYDSLEEENEKLRKELYEIKEISRKVARDNNVLRRRLRMWKPIN